MVVSNIIKLNEIIFIEIEYIVGRKRNKLLIKAQQQQGRKKYQMLQRCNEFTFVTKSVK